MSSKTSLRLSENIQNHFTPEMVETLISLRKHLHQHPELSFKEVNTSKRLVEELEKLNPISINRITETGIVARFKGQDSTRPVVAIRGDIDALPIQEESGLDYASQNAGVMHACGHDIHASWAIGAAHLLSKEPAMGDVAVILQPAEELAKGAKALIEAGVLEGISAIFGGHVDRNYEVGQVVVHEGSIAANSDKCQFTFIGKSAHGARPQEGNNPLLALSEFIQRVHQIPQNTNPNVPEEILTICEVKSGHTHNVIPERAECKGTIRSLTPEVQDRLHKEILSLVEEIKEQYKVDIESEIIKGSPAIINSGKAYKWAREAAHRVCSSEGVVPLKSTNLGAEDFGFYLQQVPGCFIRVGARYPEDDPIPAHNPKFYAEHETLFVGAAVLAEMAREASKNLYI